MLGPVQRKERDVTATFPSKRPPTRAPLELVRGRRVVLVVDDDDAMRSLLDLQLRGRGCDTLLAASARAAIELLESQRVDAILSDYSMPGGSGLNLLAYVRARRLDVDFVLTSALLTPAAEAAASAHGAVAIDKAALVESLAAGPGNDGDPAVAGSRPITPAAGLEPATLRLTAGCSAN